MKNINKILIANRGEIAIRLIKACNDMGIETVAVYSKVDREQLYVDMATEAYCIGAPEPKHSYLDIDKIIQVAKNSKADAIHPGYGFLSENTDFAKRCEEEGVIFIGPAATHIHKMGSKIEAKEAAIAAHVPVVPGFQKNEATDQELKEAAKEIGTPILIKASAGGGGRGMRLVEDLNDFDNELKLAQQEALSAFGNSAVLLEKFIRASRHVEVQIIADQLGNVVHAFERDCSIQRNHQKVLEEAPAPNLSNTIRQAMLDSAVNLAKEIGYDSLGTVEYIYDTDNNAFYFLEMNTRLQVEHPVTEMITGIDLVKTQINIATGAALPFAQADIKASGHAIEARIAAEDPSENYLPATGEITSYQENKLDGTRVDSGIRAGSKVSHYYDSMLSKAIAHGQTRLEANRKLGQLLKRYEIDGIYSNIQFLSDLIALDSFQEATHHTNTIKDTWPSGWQKPAVEARYFGEAALVYHLQKNLQTSSSNPWMNLGAWRITENTTGKGKSHYFLTDMNGITHEVILSGRDTHYSIMIDNTEVLLASYSKYRDGILSYEMADNRKKLAAEINGSSVLISASHNKISFQVETLDQHLMRLAGNSDQQEGGLTANMPGQVVEILVNVGDEIQEGQKLMVLEAMKLLQDLHAPSSGVIDAIHYQQGDSVDGGAPLLSITEKN